LAQVPFRANSEGATHYAPAVVMLGGDHDSMRRYRFLEKLPTTMQNLMLNVYEDEDLERLRRLTLSRRDMAIYGCGLEMTVSVAAITLYDLRRSILVPIVNLGLAGLSLIGLLGALNLQLRQIQIHGAVTTGLIIATLLNFLAEAFLTRTGIGSASMPSWLILLVFFIPYSLNLVCSILSLLLGSSLADFLELEEAKSDLAPTELIEQQAQECRGGDTCCICMERRKDAVFTPCGHRVVCVSCGERLKSSRRCPICRQDIHSVVRVFDS